MEDLVKGVKDFSSPRHARAAVVMSALVTTHARALGVALATGPAHVDNLGFWVLRLEFGCWFDSVGFGLGESRCGLDARMDVDG